MKIDLSLILYLHTLKLSLSHLEFLKYYESDIGHFLPERHKLNSDLIKLGYVYNGQITQKGLDLFRECRDWEGVYEPQEKVKKKKVEYSQEFLEFWGRFPTTDNFVYEGRAFTGVRSLRQNKEGCSVKYEEALKKVEHEDIMKALEFHKDLMKKKSLETNRNEMAFMNNIEVWLNQEKYLLYIPLLGMGEELEDKLIDTNELF